MSTRLVTSSADERKPPITHSSPSTTTPLASNRGTGQGVTSFHANELPALAPAAPPPALPVLTPPVPAAPALAPPAPAPPASDVAFEQPVAHANRQKEAAIRIRIRMSIAQARLLRRGSISR